MPRWQLLHESWWCASILLVASGRASAEVSASPTDTGSAAANVRWNDLEHLRAQGGQMEAQTVHGGLSNRNFKLRTVGAAEWEYIMRVPGDMALPLDHNYSRIHLVNRSMEARCARAAGAAGVSPALVEYNHTTSVMLTRWLAGHVLTASSVPHHLPGIGRALRRFHDTVSLELSADTPRFNAFDRAANYLSLAAELDVELPPHIASLFAAAAEAAEELQALPQTTTTLHCDLIPANFISTPGAAAAAAAGGGGGVSTPPGSNPGGDRDSPPRLWLFDFEYCHYGDPVWDLANFISMNNVSRADRDVFLATYGPRDDPYTLDKLTVMMWLFTISEGMWGLIHHAISDLSFDAEWTDDVASFREYGLRLLEDAMITLHDRSEVADALGRLKSAAQESSCADL